MAANVRQLRKERGLSLAQLSKNLEEMGYRLSLTVLSKIELGDRGIDVDDLIALASALNVSPGLLLEDPGHEDLRRLLVARDDAALEADRSAQMAAHAEATLAVAEQDLKTCRTRLEQIDQELAQLQSELAEGNA